MAIGWLAVLQSVPWGQVIDNAPKIVNGAKKLWSSVSRKPDSEEAELPDIHALSGLNEDSEMLRRRLTKLEQLTAELHEQMATSTVLIKELAEQNTQLIKHIEANRVRTLWMVVLCIIALISASAALAMALLPNAI
ncbi:MAG TPA: hypothetical protein VFF75_03760 [Methylophilaceae bacterium]|nr:hypothetical protein [Methylophilaceae bacterium]